MTVSSQTSNETFDGNGVTTIWPLPFRFFNNADIFVYLVDPALLVTTPLVLGTDYTLTGAGLPEQFGTAPGTITTTVPVASGKRLYVERLMDAEQLTDIVNQGRFFPEVHEDVFDKLTMLIQQNNATLRGAIRVAVADPEPTRLPMAALRANLLMGFDSLGNPIPVAPAGGSSAALALLLANEVFVSQGAAMIGRGGQVVKSIAELKTLLAGSPSKHAFVTGYYAQGDGGGGHYWLDSADVTSVDNGGTIIVAADGGRWKLVKSSAVTSKTFGAKGDKVTNDTVRLQDYVNWCASFTLWKPMVIEGTCLVTASLIVNRLVDTTLSEWRVIAANEESGFLQNTTFDLFESSLAMPGVDPQCEAITFENIRFEGGAAAGGAHILTKKFLRIKFLNCYFYKIRLLSSVTYIQSFYFSNCNIRFWPGVWLVATHAFDTHFVQCQSEFGSGFLTNFAAGSYNLTFTDGLHEGSAGGLISGGGFRQLKVDGYYLEGNATVDIALDAGGTNWGVTISNSIFAATAGNVANVNFWNVVWGPTFGAEGGGNYHLNGRLHDNSGLAAGGLLRGAAGDAATIAPFKSPINADGVTSPFTITNTLGTGTQNYANATRRGDMVRIEFSYSFVGASGSNAVLDGLPAPIVNALVSGIVNYSDYVATPVRIIGGTGFAVTLSSTRFAPSSDIAGAGITYTALNGKTIVAEMEYRVAA